MEYIVNYLIDGSQYICEIVSNNCGVFDLIRYILYPG